MVLTRIPSLNPASASDLVSDSSAAFSDPPMVNCAPGVRPPIPEMNSTAPRDCCRWGHAAQDKLQQGAPAVGRLREAGPQRAAIPEAHQVVAVADQHHGFAHHQVRIVRRLPGDSQAPFPLHVNVVALARVAFFHRARNRTPGWASNHQAALRHQGGSRGAQSGRRRRRVGVQLCPQTCTRRRGHPGFRQDAVRLVGAGQQIQDLLAEEFVVAGKIGDYAHQGGRLHAVAAGVAGEETRRGHGGFPRRLGLGTGSGQACSQRPIQADHPAPTVGRRVGHRNPVGLRRKAGRGGFSFHPDLRVGVLGGGQLNAPAVGIDPRFAGGPGRNAVGLAGFAEFGARPIALYQFDSGGRRRRDRKVQPARLDSRGQPPGSFRIVRQDEIHRGVTEQFQQSQISPGCRPTHGSPVHCHSLHAYSFTPLGQC